MLRSLAHGLKLSAGCKSQISQPLQQLNLLGAQLGPWFTEIKSSDARKQLLMPAAGAVAVRRATSVEGTVR